MPLVEGTIMESTEAGYAEAQRDMLINAVNCNIPYKYIREMISGNKEPKKNYLMELHQPKPENLDITEELATMALKTLQQYIHNIHGDCGKCICAREDSGRCWMGGCDEIETGVSNLDTGRDRQESGYE